MANEVITIKGSREGLIIFSEDGVSWDQVMDSLTTLLGGKEGQFFAGANVVFDAGKRVLTPEQVSQLWQVLQEHGLVIVSLRTLPGRDPVENPERTVTVKKYVRNGDDDISKLPTMVVRRDVRSGQDVTFAGNVVVFGDVKPGSQITASGFILVLGTLNGSVHAGAEGDEEAWVGAFHLQPTQLRIAGLITRAPDDEPLGPEIAQICDGTIVVTEMRRDKKIFWLAIGGIS